MALDRHLLHPPPGSEATLGNQASDLVHEVVATLEQVCWFRPPDARARERSLVGAASAAMGRTLEDGSVTSDLQVVRAATYQAAMIWRQLDALLMEPVADDNRSELLFAELGIRSPRGTDVGDALFAGTDHAHVERRAETLYQHLLPQPHQFVPDPRHALVSLWHSPRPLLTHTAALETRSLIESLLPDEADEVAEAYAPLMRRANYNRFAHQGVVQGLQVLESTDLPPEQALYLGASGFLDLVEVPLRLTAAAVLTLFSRQDGTSRRAGTVGFQARELAKIEHPMAQRLAVLLRPRWRNAIAHRDLRWDFADGVIVMGDSVVEMSEFLLAYQAGFCFHQGVETGVAMARAGSKELVSSLEHVVGPLPEALRENRVRDAITVSGATFRSVRREGSTFVATVPDLDLDGLEELCLGLADGLRADPTITSWVIIVVQPAATLQISSAALLRMTETAEHSSPDRPTVLLPFALLPVVASVNVARGHSSSDVVLDTQCVCLDAVLDTHERLSVQVQRRDLKAFGELSQTLRCLRLSARGVARLLDPADDGQLAELAAKLEVLERALEPMAEGDGAATARFEATLDELRHARQALPPSPCAPWLGLEPEDDLA